VGRRTGNGKNKSNCRSLRDDNQKDKNKNKNKNKDKNKDKNKGKDKDKERTTKKQRRQRKGKQKDKQRDKQRHGRSRYIPHEVGAARVGRPRVSAPSLLVRKGD
jgi:hypothetical protein